VIAELAFDGDIAVLIGGCGASGELVAELDAERGAARDVAARVAAEVELAVLESAGADAGVGVEDDAGVDEAENGIGWGLVTVRVPASRLLVRVNVGIENPRRPRCAGVSISAFCRAWGSVGADSSVTQPVIAPGAVPPMPSRNTGRRFRAAANSGCVSGTSCGVPSSVT
jgi:hypothetical protein